MRRIAILAATALAAASPAGAQQTGTVIGTVFDSLAGTPLVGATVLVRGSSRIAISEAGGRFRLDSVPAGMQIISFEHPELDSIGVTTNVARVPVRAGATVEVQLATRSGATLRRGVCGSAAIGAFNDSGVVFGTIRDAQSGIRLAGARAQAIWTTARRAEDGRVLVDRPMVTASSDSTGSYYLCGVPADLVIDVAARADSFNTGSIEVLVGPRGFYRRDLTISREPSTGPTVRLGPTSVSAAAAPAIPQTTPLRRGAAILKGRVLDERGQPVAGARVLVDNTETETRTGTNGEFVLGGLPAGSQMAMARIIGYTARRVPVDLRNRDTTRVVFRVRSVTVLDTIRVIASPAMQRELDNIADRRRVAAGTFIGEQELKTRTSIRAAVEGAPGLDILAQRGAQSAYEIYMRRSGTTTSCIPTVYIDGIRASTEELIAYQPRSLIAVEIYQRSTASLGRYAATDECGVILAWTRALR